MTRRVVNVTNDVKLPLERLKIQLGFKTESEVIEMLLVLYTSIDKIPMQVFEKVMELKK
jgi:hypothetical protein